MSSTGSARTAREPLSSIIDVVRRELRRHPELRKSLSAQHQGVFATDLSLVAVPLRTGYLLDLFSPNDAVSMFSRLIASLRAHPSVGSQFSSVSHVYEPASEQSFFVNATLLAERLENPPIFLRLGSPISSRSEIPDRLQHVLDSLRTILRPSNGQLPLSHTLPADIPTDMAVALAAVLLDYAVAYIPVLSQEDALSAVPLDFYEGLLKWAKLDCRKNDEVAYDRCSIMKFSCPAGLAEEYSSLTPAEITRRMDELFLTRLQGLEDQTLQVEFQHTTQTLARVAF